MAYHYIIGCLLASAAFCFSAIFGGCLFYNICIVATVREKERNIEKA